jgi:hypothetical protein
MPYISKNIWMLCIPRLEQRKVNSPMNRDSRNHYSYIMEISPLLFNQSEDMTKVSWICLVKSMFGGNAMPPSFFRRYQMELLLLAPCIDNNLPEFKDLHCIYRRLRLQLRILYHILAKHSSLQEEGVPPDDVNMIWFKRQRMSFRVNTDTMSTQLEYALESTNMNESQRLDMCKKRVLNAMNKYKFGIDFSLYNSCKQVVTSNIVWKYRCREGVTAWPNSEVSQKMNVYVTQLHLPHHIQNELAFEMSAWICGDFDMKVFNCAECPLYRVLASYARGEYLQPLTQVKYKCRELCSGYLLD